MRRSLAAAALAGLVLASCGTDAMSADDYFAAAQDAAVTYDEAAAEISAQYAAALDDTIADFATSGASADDPVALGNLAGEAASQAIVSLGATGIALEQYGIAVSDLTPPVAAEAAHGEFVASLTASVAAVAPSVERLASVASVNDLGPAVAGSPFSDARPRLERACIALQEVGEASGVTVDLRCVPAAAVIDDAP